MQQVSHFVIKRLLKLFGDDSLHRQLTLALLT